MKRMTRRKKIFSITSRCSNRKRKHGSLGYVSSAVYEEMHEIKQEQAA